MQLAVGKGLGLALLSALALSISGVSKAQDSGGADPSQATNPGSVTVWADALGHTNDSAGVWPPPPGQAYSLSQYLTLNRNPAVLDKNRRNPCDKNGKPILPQSGTKIESYPLFKLPGEMGLEYTIFYNTAKAGNAPSTLWTDSFFHGLDLNCEEEGGPPQTGECRFTTVFRPDGSLITFSGGPNSGVYTELSGSQVVSLTRDAGSGVYTFHDEDGMTSTYDINGRILTRVDSSGIGWTFSYSGSTKTVTHTSGRAVTVSTQTTTATQNGTVISGSTVTVTDPAGNAYVLKYGTLNEPTASVYDLASIQFPGSPTTVITFKYMRLAASPYTNLLQEVDYNGTPYAYTTYNTADSTSKYYGWAVSTYLADGSENFSNAYATDSSGYLAATVTNPLGHQSVQSYAGVNGTTGLTNGQLTLVSDDAVLTCGATVHGYAYDNNGNMSEQIDNNQNLHTFNFAANGQLQTETEASGSPVARTTDYVWDPNPQLNRTLSVTVEGWKKTAYGYTAQNRIASIAVTNLSSHGSANQTLATIYGYTLYGNGMVQSQTVTYPSPSGSNTDTYAYDALGNLTSVTNGLGQAISYSNYNGLGEVGRVVGPNGDATDYTYDARGRIATKTTYPNGSAAIWTYTYDGFGLPYTLSGPDGQVTTWNRDAQMRVLTITHNDKDGASTESFSYDANSDVIEHKIVRGSTVGLDEVFHYDALGRVYQKIGQNGQTLTYAYDANGNVLSVTDATGHAITYQYDALNRVTQKSENGGGASPAMPTGTPTINAPASNTTGGYSVSWTSVTGATTYLLQEQVNGGSWSTIQNSSAISWTASNKASNTYGYRVQGCNATGCGPWSSVVATAVLLPPSTPSLSVPTSNNTGSYAVSWTSVATATSYNLMEQIGGGAWITIQSSAGTSWSATGKTNNTYGYEVQACNATGCSAWSPVGAVQVLLPPASAPSLTAPANNATGSYSISWTSVATAASYTLQEQINGGAWSTVQSGSGTAWSAAAKSNGTYAYQVQACNAGGCSAWSATGTTVVLLPPGSPPSVTSPSTSSTGTYTVSWSTIPSATSYNLQEQLNGGAWTTVQSTGATSWSASGKANGTYGYHAQSCNGGGCSGWSSVSTTTVLHPPGSAPTLTVPSSSATGSYTVSWASVATATTYNLQERLNGGAWTTVQSSAALSWSVGGHGNGTYGYQVQACNSSGCGPWSAVGSATVLLPPGAAPTVSSPGSSANGTYTVSWSAVATATSYNLQEQVNGGGWTTVQSSASTSWGTSGRGNGTYGYHAQACNSSGCGPWSGVASTTVLWPPSGAPSLSLPSRNYSGSYTVSWSGVSTASSYTLQEQVNGGAWTTVQANGNTSWSTSGRGNGTYGYQVIACNASGCGPWSGSASVLEIVPAPIALNGKGYSVLYGIPLRQTGSDSIGISIVNGNTWQVVSNKPGQLGYVLASGAIPSWAVTVQFTYTSLGPPPGDTDAAGSVTNGAASPVAISGNPTSLYTTGTFSGSTTHGRQYSVKVDFFDSTGTNISSSTCNLIAETASGS